MSAFSPSSETELASQIRRDITNRREAHASHHKSALLVLPLLLLLSASTAATDSLTDAAVAFTSQDPQCFSGSTGSIGRIESGPCLILRSLLRDALCRERWSSIPAWSEVGRPRVKLSNRLVREWAELGGAQLLLHSGWRSDAGWLEYMLIDQTLPLWRAYSLLGGGYPISEQLSTSKLIANDRELVARSLKQSRPMDQSWTRALDAWPCLRTAADHNMMFAANTDWGSDFACANVRRTGLLKSDLAHFRDLISRTAAAFSMLSKLQQQTMRRMQCCAATIDEQLDWFALYMRCIKVGRDPCGEPSAELKTLMQQDGVLPMSIKDDMFDGSQDFGAHRHSGRRNTRCFANHSKYAQYCCSCSVCVEASSFCAINVGELAADAPMHADSRHGSATCPGPLFQQEHRIPSRSDQSH